MPTWLPLAIDSFWPMLSAGLKAAIDKALEEIKADGIYARISQKYFGADVSK